MKKTLAILMASPVLYSSAWCGTLQQRLPDSSYQDGEHVRVAGEETKFSVVRGAGRDMPLYKALAAIIPRGYTLRTVGVERGLLDEPVTWAGGREWTEVLSDVISMHPELVVDIATGSKVVILRQINSAGDGNAARYASDAMRRKESGAKRDVASNKEGGFERVSSVKAASTPVAVGHARAAIEPKEEIIKVAAPAKSAPLVHAVAAVAEPTPAPMPAPAKKWEISIADKTLKSVMARWAASDSWQFSWELTVDYPVDARASIPGTFEQAVEAVVKSMEKAEIPMRAIFYKGNKVLRIVAKGVE